MATATANRMTGTNVFLSRNLVPPEMYDSLHDALQSNGAQVFPCSDPSRTSPNDYHVISSPTHEKFEVLKAKGCNLIGPHCVLTCAKERRALPNQAYTCCLAMDGVKILASGFEKEEKVKIKELMSSMGGVLQSRVSADISFVIVKDVLAAKYKWAVNVLKKPVVNMSWLNQCWTEHHLVPHEPHKILPFNGLNISVTRLPLDERKKMERLILQNGGVYSANLTKNCTHLVSDTPEGDKYMFAKLWGHILIVNRRWIYQSVVRKVCLEERRYPVSESFVSYSDIKSGAQEQYSQDCSNTTSQAIPSKVFEDVEASFSQKISSFSDAVTAINGISEASNPMKCGAKFDHCVAEDSEEEGNDLYLANCGIVLLGFERVELRNLVGMIRRGGGKRYMQLSEKLTHVIVGSPSEIERKETRELAAWGIIDVVKPVWLEDCERLKKEVSISQKHIASDLVFPKDSTCFNEVPTTGVIDIKKGRIFPNNDGAFSFAKVRGREENESNILESNNFDSSAKSEQNVQASSVNTDANNIGGLQIDSEFGVQRKSLNIFKGHLFCFSKTFPQDRRDEIIESVRQGGGFMVDDNQGARFIIQCHGLEANHAVVSHSTVVSSHWIRSCLEEGCIQDVSSHILYKPLCCRVPLPGFEVLRFCVSQYEAKERQLLRNLCFTLGSKCTEKLNKKVTHLLCKFTEGLKYETACKWKIRTVTAEWVTECIKQDMMVSFDPFRPMEVTAEDKDAGLWTTSQYPTQTTELISEVIPSQTSQSLHRKEGTRDASEYSIAILGKRQRFPNNTSLDNLSSKTKWVENTAEASNVVSDVADVIEEILEKSNKIQSQKLSEANGCNRNKFSSDHSIIGRDHADSASSFRIPNLQEDRPEEHFDFISVSKSTENQKTFFAFSETQTESQVVGYEEDLTGRQKIIDRVRSQSLTSTPDMQNE